ncbi:MAG: gliding motility-associated C-terminal domain-containing protein, partial [Saprospiraceae bacterium]|nr:gliding motility-associated C-terminal domain-containing protein [Saprospiraceae bacterium]
MTVRYLLSLLTAICVCGVLNATHNRAGEITYQQIGDLTIRAVITTYTKTSSVPADRDTLELFWGDGTSTMVARSNGNGMPLPNDIKINYYIAEHTYPGRATYTLSMMDPNRIGGILNVNPPNSDGVPFYLETTFTFLNTQFQGYNNSP